MDNCVFCKIVRGELPSYRIYEDKEFLAFLDISQFTEGHCVVIPKKHVEFVWDYKNNNKYFEVVTKIANHFRSLGYRYVDSMTFGRMIAHAHIHLIPHNGENSQYKQSLSGLGNLQSGLDRRLTKEKGEEVAKKLRLK